MKCCGSECLCLSRVDALRVASARVAITGSVLLGGETQRLVANSRRASSTKTLFIRNLLSAVTFGLGQENFNVANSSGHQVGRFRYCDVALGASHELNYNS